MAHVNSRHRNGGDPLIAFGRRFARQEDGTITIFACFMIMMMLMIGGIGADMMRHEMERTRIQAVADRAVLAAADLDQTLDPEFVVRDYFEKSGMADFVSSVTVDQGLNYKTVTVDASTTINTQFMDALGVETLSVPAISTAEEKVSKVEISLVVDISGSMNSNQKMARLQNAAKVFVDTVITPENKDLISLSLVPYSEHVNPGPLIFNRLSVNKMHDYSYCIEFPDAEFNSTRLNHNITYDQMQHFQWNYYSITSGWQVNTRTDTVCPRWEYEQILPFSQNAQQIKDQIDLLRPRVGTAIYLGMKWGVALLDPSYRRVNRAISDQGYVDAVFRPRPVAYSDTETLKTVILMTDGQNSSSQRITPWYYDSSSEVAHWANYNLNFYLYNYLSSWQHSSFYETKYTSWQGDSLLQNICDAAKNRNIVIWSIGFEVTDHGANVMRNCASSPSHFFRVEGVQISEAFSSIARQINQLRLTQ
ncbi:MAG: Tad domain-containing protein [Sulfitobacter sp.]|nr:Tad domain-containing protein [Sulfitobacter sp.]